MLESYLLMDVVKPVSEYGEEEKLVVSDSWWQVLLPEDLVVIETELKIGGSIPTLIGVKVMLLLTNRVFSRKCI